MRERRVTLRTTTEREPARGGTGLDDQRPGEDRDEIHEFLAHGPVLHNRLTSPPETAPCSLPSHGTHSHSRRVRCPLPRARSKAASTSTHLVHTSGLPSLSLVLHPNISYSSKPVPPLAGSHPAALLITTSLSLSPMYLLLSLGTKCHPLIVQ